ncbi:alpha/beta hydrolase family protein [Gordonia sp. ABSL1-1]|uniref:alpha/beta hydrolase n=1 Tax=Gordonia sp. ABSL1-1 TaxID=3053923 RepID=UPI0025728F91|nr:alpha/beta hydrolase family protein [Gordonia sp. ABSL1-1]MDL9936662.1 alpha/beta hydrolase family protein [Gordonia sp. ABSL1-1]
MRARLASAIIVGLTALVTLVIAAGPATAVPTDETPVASRIVSSTTHDPQYETLSVYSASMRKIVKVDVLRPRDPSATAPVLYLLNGAGGGFGTGNWASQTDYRQLFADQNVYVVTPIGGAYSYYADWLRPDPVLGVNKWQTFMTRELPPLIDAHYPVTGVNGLAGISMAGTSVFNLAIAAPRLYRSVAAFSGCARTSDPIGQLYIRAVVEGRGGGDTTNMWGPPTDPRWRANDPYLNAARLRGIKLYMTSGSGLPGARDRIDDPRIDGKPLVLLDQLVVGGVIEAGVDQCTRQMIDRLHQLHIPVTATMRPEGTHSWVYWQEDLHRTWPSMARDLAG